MRWVVHGKGNLFQKMPGDDWQKFANLRSLYAYMFTHPGKKTLFMGMEFGQTTEWNAWLDLNWSLLNFEPHQKLKQLVADLNALYKQERSLYTDDFSAHGFEWIDCNDADNSVVSFIRQDKYSDKFIVTVCNFTPGPITTTGSACPSPATTANCSTLTPRSTAAAVSPTSAASIATSGIIPAGPTPSV